MVYKYVGVDENGKKVSAKLEASSLDEAKRRLKAQKIIYKNIKEETFSLFRFFKFKRSYSISASELANISRDFSIYLRSGISLVNAVNLSLNQYTNSKKLTLFLQSIKTSLDEGKNFYYSLENQTAIKLPNFYKQSIKVSEDSGILDEVLLELSKFLKNQDRVNKQIQGAFAYPIFILVISILMVGFMMTYVVPKITSIFKQMDQELPKVTQVVVNLGTWLANNWMLALGIFFAIIIVFKLLIYFNKKFRYSFHYLLLKIPFFGKIIQNTELGRFTYVSSILLRSGVPFVQTVNLGAKILKNSVLRDSFENASKKVVEGSRLSKALMAGAYVPDISFVQAIALGEETSEVSPILKNLSELYFEENKDKLAIFLSLLEPLLMLFVGGTIGFIVTAMLLPIFSINIQ